MEHFNVRRENLYSDEHRLLYNIYRALEEILLILNKQEQLPPMETAAPTPVQDTPEILPNSPTLSPAATKGKRPTPPKKSVKAAVKKKPAARKG